MKRVFTIRRIVISGVLAAIAILLGATRLGFIPVPTPAGHATIMHIPAIVGGIIEGWVVGWVIGTIFGLFSFFYATIPLFKDPLVAILPRMFIGITSYFSYRALRRAGISWALIIAGFLLGLAAAFGYEVGKINVPASLIVGGLSLGLIGAFVNLALRGEAEVIALSVAAAVGTLTNTILVLGMGVIRGYLPISAAILVGITHGIPEIIIAVIIVLAVATAWRRIEKGS
jgi:uncharacterized membrane protein